MPRFMPSRGERTVTGLPSRRIVPEVAGSMPKRASPTSVRPAPISPAKPSTSPRWRSKVTPSNTPWRPRLVTERTRSFRAARRPRLRQIDLAADHVGDCALRRRLAARARRYQPSVAKDRNLVGDLEHLLHAMADKEDGDALPLQVADKLEQLLNLMGGERRRRLVHDQDANVERNRLGDFDRLLGGQRQSARRISHVQRDAELGEDRFGLVETSAASRPPRRGPGG